MQTKFTNHFTPPKMAIIKMTDTNKYWWGCEEVGNLIYWWWAVLQNKHRVSHDPAILFLGIYPREMKTYIHTKTCTWMFIVALSIIVKKWNKPKHTSTDEWINKVWYIHIVAYYSSI